MAECIEREATIKRIKEVCCAGCNSYDGVRCRACGTGDAIDIIEDATTVNAVIVTRCKNCRSYNKPKTGWCEVHLDREHPDDFCSYGKRKDGGDG